MIGKCFLVLAVLCALSGEGVEGKRMLLRPIPASKVREILKAAGREDALPEGRVISHGLAALNGFALGLKKGIIGVALADSWAALSMTNTTTSSTGSASKPSFSYNSTSDQLCFTSRSATSDIVASGDAEERAEAVAAYAGTTTPTVPSTPTSPSTPIATTTDATSPTTTNTATGTGTGTNTVTNTGTTTETTGGAVNCIVLQKG